MDNIIRLGGITYKNKIAGPWECTTIYTQGCYKRCKGCFNPDLQPLSGGKEFSINEVFEFIAPFPDKVSFCGGEPMIWARQLAELARRLKAEGFTILCYTGYEWEDIMKPNEWMREHLPDARGLAESVDILVVGEYIESLRTPIEDYQFVGSSNQRVIDVKKSLEAGFPVLYSSKGGVEG